MQRQLSINGAIRPHAPAREPLVCASPQLAQICPRALVQICNLDQPQLVRESFRVPTPRE
jgi:hypothetical protein